MFKRSLTWKERAVIAEAELATTQAALETAQQHLAGIELRFAERAALVSIARQGRINKFMFLRNGQLTTVECMGTWDDDVDGWKKALLEPLPPNEGS
jgi:hypothetical protein